mgnify:FL=1
MRRIVRFVAYGPLEGRNTFQRVHDISPHERNTPRILLPLHARTKRCHRKEESHDRANGTDNANLLGRSSCHGRISPQSVHDRGRSHGDPS